MQKIRFRKHKQTGKGITMRLGKHNWTGFAIGMILTWSFLLIGCNQVQGQECVDCRSVGTTRGVSLFQSPTVRTFEVVEMQKQLQTIEVEVPVTRKYEEITYTREVFDGGLGDFLQGGPIKRLRERIQERRQQRGRRGRVRGFSWGCLVNAFAAYSQCAMSRRR